MAIARTGDLQSAIDQLAKLLLTYPSASQCWMEIGRLHRRTGDRAQALQAFQKAEELNPNHPVAAMDIGIELRELGQFSESAQKFNKFLAHHPQNIGALHHLGILYKKQQETEKAIEIFEQALSINDKHVQTRFQLGLIYREKGEPSLAEQQFKTILVQQPDHLKSLIHLGTLAREDARTSPNNHNSAKLALSYYEQAAHAHPQNIEPRLQLARTFRLFKRFAESEAVLKNLVAEQPQAPQAYLEWGHLHREQGAHQQSIECFEKAQQYAQQPIQALHACVQVAIGLSELGQLAAATNRLNQVLEQAPNHFFALQTLGSLYRKQHHNEKAIDCYQRSIAAEPKHLPAHLQLATIWREMGQYNLAQQQLETALTYHPNHLNVLINLAVLAREQQSIATALENALGYCERAIQSHPRQVEPVLHKADTLRHFNQLERAEAELKALHQQYPNDPQVLLKLGHWERQKGERQKALKWFELAQQQATSPVQALNIKLFVAEELRELNQLDEALTLSNQALQQHPENIRAKMVLGSILQKQLNLAAAEDLYKAISATAPHELAPKVELAKMLSETHRVPAAICRLEELFQAGHRELWLIMQLGHLANAQEDWDRAADWYKIAQQQHPHKPQVYGALANVLYRQGEIEAAMRLLTEAGDRLPHCPEIPLQLANLKLRFGYPDESLKILQSTHLRFSTHLPTTFQLIRLHLQQGAFAQATALLQGITSDQSNSRKQIAHLQGDMTLRQFQLEQSIQHFQQAIRLTPVTHHERQQLAHALFLSGNIDEAHTQLITATEEIRIKQPPSVATIPIKDHVAVMVNQMRLNPPMLAKLQNSSSKTGHAKLLTLAEIIAQEPNYLGSSIFLARELRQQGIFAAVRAALPIEQPNFFQIPQRIIQFWDDPTPPPEIQQIGESWLTLNPEYKYIRFSFQTAFRFIQRHYPSSVLKAFQYCEHPATQADLFRLAYLNKMGGFYADADDRCRASLDGLVASNAELIVYQETYASIGNNFLGCIPGHPMIRAALDQAVKNLLSYTTEGPWLTTGPGLMTISVCQGLVPHIASTDYQTWPKLLVLSQEELRNYEWPHTDLPYKRSEKSWIYATYRHSKKQKPLSRAAS